MQKAAFIFLGTLLVLGLGTLVYQLMRPASGNLALDKDKFYVKAVTYLHEDVADKAIIILPPTGGMNILDRLYGESFFRAGFDVYILTEWTQFDEFALDLDIHQRHYTRVQKAIGMLINEVKAPWTGIMGTSVGGLHASIAMSTHDELKAAVVITGGIRVPEVIVNSDQEAMRFAKKKRYEMYNFKNDDQYLDDLSKAFHLDPTQLAKKFTGKKLGVVFSTKDTTVPYENQKKLQELWNAKVIDTFDHNHFYTIVRMGLLGRDEVVGFFK